MSSSYTVIMPVRHRFGDQRDDRNEVDVDSAAPFEGRVGDFAFTCPDVDPRQKAVLQFEHRGSTQRLTFPDPQPDGGLVGITREHPVRINGTTLFGGIPAAPFRFGQMPLWSTRVLVVPEGVLRDENVLRIESTTEGSLNGQNADNFTVDNVVLFYRTRPGPGGVVVES